MDVKTAIPQSLLKEIVFKTVPENFDEHPGLCIDGFVDRLEPKLMVSYDSLNEDQKSRVKYRLEQFNETKVYIEKNLNDKKFNSHKVQDYLVNSRLEQLMKKFSTEELTMMYLSGFLYTYNNDIKEWYEKENVHVWLANKIKLSSWHHSGNAHWNTVAMAYNIMSNFTFGEGFEVSIDTASHYNNKGYSRFTRTFIDAELAFIVSYKGEHVLSIGFNVIERWKTHKRYVQIRQIQCKKRTGNRWLYKIKGNLTAHVLKRFVEQFVGFKVQLIKGESIKNEIKEQYESIYEKAKERLEDAKKSHERQNTTYTTDHLRFSQERYDDALKMLSRFREVDECRIVSIYDIRANGIRKLTNKNTKDYYTIKLTA